MGVVDQKSSNEEIFRSGLDAAIAIVSGLEQHVESVSDLLEIMKLGLTSESQCKLVMSIVTSPARKLR